MNDRITFSLLRVTQAAGRLATAALKPLGVQPRQYAVLELLVRLGPLSQQDLADMLAVDRATMVAVVDELERAGYVRRSRNPTDRRAYAIEPRPAGKQLARRAAALLDACEEHFLGPLTPDERGQLTRMLRRLLTPNPT